MKKYLALGALFLAASASAQNIYQNAEISSTSDVIGTSRYVSMGGAMGALGADISAIGNNPAAIGLFRKSDISLTAGLLWPKDRTYDEGDNLTHGTFDQLGFVAAMHLDEPNVKFVNVAFNYQKKFNFANAFYADNGNTRGLSQVDNLASISNYNNYYNEYNLLGTAYNSYVMDKDDVGYYNSYSAYKNRYTHYSTGSTQAFDLNVSTNIKDRYYLGLTLGIENVNYDRYSLYAEEREGQIFDDNNDGVIDGKDETYILDYSLYNDQSIDGYGLNFKVGGIVRPIEENPLRVGLAIESPTWYRLKSKTWHSIDSKFDADGNYQADGYVTHNGYDESYLEYILRTPWRARLAIGSTLDQYLAWDIEYEYANYGKNRMKYPDDGDYYESSSFAGVADKGANRENKNVFRGQHTVRAGVEFKPSADWAIRFGYNYISSIYKDGARLNQYIDSPALDYMTSTNYMNLSDANVLACGIGYRHKRFYIDMTYKFRQQNGEFYAFDDSFSSEGQFVADNPGLANIKLQPVDVNLNRHTITWTMGFKF
ncbi:MAG: hypothetical protein IJ253_00070 [Bacteroidaceae bacterium]|nr:hypothetical protein [Bacteroidaceae bacterium]